jgi:hypothetical protein
MNTIHILLWVTGGLVWGAVVAVVAMAFLFILFRVFTASVDIVTQLLYIKLLGKIRHNVSIKEAWWTSFEISNWSRIMCRIRKIMKGKNNAG